MSFVRGWERGLRRGAAAGRLAPVLLAATLAAAPARAQSTASTTTQAASPPVLYNGAGNGYYARLDTIGTAAPVALARAQALHALRSVYAELQVPLTDGDSASGWLGNLRLIRTMSLGRMPLSRVIDCGSEMTGPVADQARIEMALVTFVQAGAADSTSSVRTALVASSQSLGGAQRDRVQCSTKGYLEAWIRTRLMAQRAQH